MKIVKLGDAITKAYVEELNNNRIEFKEDPEVVEKIASCLFNGVYKYLNMVTYESTVISFYVPEEEQMIDSGLHPKQLGDFIAYATLINDPDSGWIYRWSFEDDRDAIDTPMYNYDSFLQCESALVFAINMFARNNHGMSFTPGILDRLIGTMFIPMLKLIKKWLMDNATEKDVTSLVLDDVFKANAKIIDGKTEIKVFMNKDIIDRK